MAELSRIKKYKDLRESITQDLDSNDVTTTKELSRFQKRLNQIDANNFHRSGDYTAVSYTHLDVYKRQVK